MTIAFDPGSRRRRRKASVEGIAGRELATNARRISWLHLRKNQGALCLVLIGCCFVTAVLSVGPDVTWVPGFLRGMTAGLAVSAIAASAAHFLTLSDASSTWRVGALGEFWTSQELRKLGPHWTVLNNLRIPAADGSEREVDHIAIGPGGVLVVDSKMWPSKARQIDASSSPAINEAARGVNTQAAIVRRFLGEISPDGAVTPTVMIWGSDLLSPPDRVLSNKDGVHIVHGRDAEAWLQVVDLTTRLDAKSIAALVEKLKPYLVPKQRWRDARPPSDWTRPSNRTRG